MKTVRLQRRHWQLAACVVGFIASAVPVVIWTSPFWGFAMPRQADGVPGIHVRKVEAESPADEAGLRTDDTIQRVEGQSLEPLQLQARISGLEVGEELNVEVQRGPEGLELTFRAREREVAALMYWTWQPLAAAGFAALALAACFAPRPRLRGALEWFERIALPLGIGLLALLLSGELATWEWWSIRLETPRFTWRETVACSSAAVCLMATLFELREAHAPRLRELYGSIASEASVE